MRVGLIACGAAKGTASSVAADLYRGGLFRACRAYVEAVCDEWAILSARYGLVRPDDVIEPYNVGLRDLSMTDRLRWYARTRAQVVDAWPMGSSFVTTAGRLYRAALEGLDVWCPWDELPDARFGHQMRWLKENTP